MNSVDLMSLLVAWLPFVILVGLFILMGGRICRQYAESIRLSTDAIAVIRENTQALRALTAKPEKAGPLP